MSYYKPSRGKDWIVGVNLAFQMQNCNHILKNKLKYQKKVSLRYSCFYIKKRVANLPPSSILHYNFTVLQL